MTDIHLAPVDAGPIMATGSRATNAELIVDCHRLGYLRADWRILDPTYGRGIFWQRWQPDLLTACDLNPAKSPIGYPVDFTALPWPDRHFDAVVLDGPYKLNGTPTVEVDAPYGVDVVATWQDRMALLRAGVTECARVLGDGYLLVKCQDQVCSGRKRWQTIDLTEHAETCGLGLVDRLDMIGGRAQPGGTRQVHSRSNASTMLIFQRGWTWRPQPPVDPNQDALDFDTAPDTEDIAAGESR